MILIYGPSPIYLPTNLVGCFVVDRTLNQQSDTASWTRTERKDCGPPGWVRTAMNAQQLLQEISDYCRQAGLAESTFGRRAVNDGKLANRLRNGGRITTDTLDRIRAFMSENRADMSARPALIPRAHEPRPPTMPMPMPAGLPTSA